MTESATEGAREGEADAGQGGVGAGQGEATDGSGEESHPTTGRSAGGEIEIDAGPERVWRALTEAAELERWFPLDAEVEPGEGGSMTLSWGNEFASTSEILAWEPGRRLRTAWGDWHGEDAGQVTDYLLEARHGRTFLRVVTSGFPDDAAWDDWVEGTRRGWRFELRSLKEYLERHDGRERSVIYLRRRVPLDAREAWDRIFAPDALGWPPMEGEPFDQAPPLQYAARIEDPEGGLLRVSLEPCGPEVQGRDVTLWLQAWGDEARGLPEIESDWTRLLERVFPDGETP